MAEQKAKKVARNIMGFERLYEMAADTEALKAALCALQPSDPLWGSLHALLDCLHAAELSRDMERAQGNVLRRHLYESQMANAPGRLTGVAQALNLDLAKAVKSVPPWVRGAVFDRKAYLAENADVAAAQVAPLKHYLKRGAAEGRPPGGLWERYPDALPKPGHFVDLLHTSEAVFPWELSTTTRAEARAALGDHVPRVSVVIPTYNRSHVLGRALKSALLQSLCPHQILVIDDGSTDGTSDILLSDFAEPLRSGQMQLIKQSQCGVSAARNAGLRRAEGEIIAYLDSDNQWEPDHLWYAVAALCSASEASCAYTATLRHNLDTDVSEVGFERFNRTALEVENCVDLNSLVHWRAALGATDGFDTALTRLVDWDLILRLTERNPAQSVAVVTAHHFISGSKLKNITVSQGLEENMTHIRRKLSRSAPT